MDGFERYRCPIHGEPHTIVTAQRLPSGETVPCPPRCGVSVYRTIAGESGTGDCGETLIAPPLDLFG